MRKVWERMRISRCTLRWRWPARRCRSGRLLARRCRLPSCPISAKLPEKVLSKDEQQGKVNEMIEKGQTHQTEAAKEIEKGK